MQKDCQTTDRSDQALPVQATLPDNQGSVAGSGLAFTVPTTKKSDNPWPEKPIYKTSYKFLVRKCSIIKRERGRGKKEREGGK